MGLVFGKNVTVFKYDADVDVWVPYACARSCSLPISTGVLETSITGSGKFKTFLPTANSFTGTLEGLMTLEKINTIGIADLIALQLAQTILLMRFEYQDDDSHTFTMEASFIITGSTVTSSFDNVTTFSVDLQGTGALTLIYTPTPLIQGVMHRVEFTLPAGSASVGPFTELNGIDPDNIIAVELDGMDRPIIITSGTPIGQEVKVGATGVITFPYADPDNDINGHFEYQTIN